MEAPAGGVDDMTKLSYLHEPGVLQNLGARYELNEIYVRLQFLFNVGFSYKLFLEQGFSYKLISLYLSDLLYNLILYYDLCNRISIIVADLYRKYSYCHKSISKIASSV